MTTTTTNAKTSLLRKITMSEVFGLARKAGGFKPVRDFGAKMETNEKGEPTGAILPFAPVLICRVVGVVRSSKVGTTDFGDYIEFSGNFGATNAKGENFRAPKCILPDPAQSLLEDALQSAGEGNSVELAFDFHAVPDSGDRGYKYRVTPLMQQPEDDPVARLSRDMATQFALAAPVAAPAAEPAPAEDAKVKKPAK